MNKDKKIELQNKIIHNLQQENASLLAKVNELEKQVNDNQDLITEANNYRTIHDKNMDSLINTRNEYLKLISELNEMKSKYKKEMNKILKITKKNI